MVLSVGDFKQGAYDPHIDNDETNPFLKEVKAGTKKFIPGSKELTRTMCIELEIVWITEIHPNDMEQP